MYHRLLQSRYVQVQLRPSSVYKSRSTKASVVQTCPGAAQVPYGEDTSWPEQAPTKPRRNLQTFGWCLHFKQSYPQVFAILRCFIIEHDGDVNEFLLSWIGILLRHFCLHLAHIEILILSRHHQWPQWLQPLHLHLLHQRRRFLGAIPAALAAPSIRLQTGCLAG